MATRSYKPCGATLSLIYNYSRWMERNGVHALIAKVNDISAWIAARPHSDPHGLGADEVFDARMDIASFLKELRARRTLVRETESERYRDDDPDCPF